jgi:hypothetical protein
MKKFLLSLLVFGFLQAQSQLTCENILFFQINAGQGQCKSKLSECVGPDAAMYVVEGRLTICFEDLDGNPPPTITGVGGFANYVFCIDDVQTTGNRTCVRYCVYSTGDGDVFNLGNVGKNIQVNFSGSLSGSCSIDGPGEGGPEPAPLPVTFASFIINRNNDKANVQWQTAMEASNSGFYVERKTGNEDWKIAGFVPSKAQDGNSNSLLSYSFNEINVNKGITQYRIRQVDIDGRNRLSEIRTLRGLAQIAKTIIYPNPSMDGKVSVVFEEAKTLRDLILIDMSGKVLQQWRGVANNNHQIENLQSGVYTLRIIERESGNQVNEKIIINRR